MAKHIYMSVGARDESGSFVNSETGFPDYQMNYRGLADKAEDDPVYFSERMAKKGHLVVFVDSPLPPGSLHTVDIGGDQTTFLIHYPSKAFPKSALDALFPAK